MCVCVTVTVSVRVGYAAVYADGVRLGYIWQHTVTRDFSIPSNTRLLAVYADNHDGGDYGFILRLSSGFVTDASWRCIGTGYTDWDTPGYDDSHWPSAVIIPKPASWPAHNLNPAQIIWVADSTDIEIFCRAWYSK